MGPGALAAALGADGPAVVGPDVSPGQLAAALGPAEHPLVLAAADARGWFGGGRLVCWRPAWSGCVETRAAAAVLEAAFDGTSPSLAAAVLPYCGPVQARTYRGGLVWTPGGWLAWGDPAALPVPSGPPSAGPVGGPLLEDATTDLDERAYLSAVERVRERIAAGDVYVLNLTYRVSGRPAMTPEDAFRALLARSAGPMSALWSGPQRALASVSPERFCAVVRGGDGSRRAWIEPIKGTRPRGTDDRADARLARELSRDPKERAEHVMILDLERNDLGRVAVPGTVRVTSLLEVFPTPYCHQLVSRVEAALAPDASLGDLLEATFPCGSVTGAPKRAALRIIDESERSPRGAYTGSLAVAVPGALDSSVLIRTLEYEGPALARWGTGGGITIDSDARAEWREARLKASPVLGTS